MRFKIVIDCDNAAFGETCADMNAEIARILRKAAEILPECEIEFREEFPLFDVNGNRVGVMSLTGSKE